jgi:signal transduction histidine kinase/ActR/RegA family two-component response regulator
MLRADGDPFWARVEAAAAQDVDGAPVCRAVMSDITERKHAEASSEQLHAQLLQAQKMEAIGRLAGGVAHDFNNSVQVILGYIDIALNEISPDNPMRAHLDEIEKAAQRSADLTRKLLAFARKQTIAPRVLDLNATIESLLAILRRLIGEEIDLRWKPAAALWPVKIDPVQVDQMMTNLLLNARDAIAQPAPQSDAPRQASGNGIIIVETENAVYDEAFCLAHAGFLPGQYVRLAVSDDGCGMDWAAQERLFEPYHTTKPLGQGGGLGLATVYGIVKQNGGFLYAQSKPGLGSTFSLYLPRTTETLPPIKTPRRSAEAPSGNETILLVEDEPALLRSACLLLEGLGYTGLAAAGPIQALRVATEHAGTIDLLLTDVIMPEMNGHALWSRLHALRPGMRCVFMSGYPAEIIAHHGVLDEGVNFLQKLFTKQVLAAKVREALETE